MQAPDNSSQADNNQCTINKGAEPNLAELSGDAPFENITYRVESRIIGITNEVCTRLISMTIKVQQIFEDSYKEHHSAGSFGT